ncbi:MAG: Hexokinase [Rhodobacteraceae bacterium HLUCCO07]|uniref:hypothetical protein n=1 Tax=Aquicoccus sp. TaxID=2055851 RepID=UPI0006DAD30F|nr:MAG: Hexokinase [Rhodobacteraceae bacterium HLUCCO07]
MDRDEALNRRGDLIEERTSDYIRRSKRIVLDTFGIEAAKEQSTLTLQLATAMIHLEAAELNAASLRRIARTLEQKDG